MDGLLGKNYLKNYISKTDPMFEAYLTNRIKQAKIVHELPAKLLEYFLSVARLGKKIRGSMAVLGYEVSGGTNLEAIYPASLFIEFTHAGALAHDDIMDEDSIRRGLPTIHKHFTDKALEIGVVTNPVRYGESLAMMAGDAAFYMGLDFLNSSAFSPEVSRKAIAVYVEYILRLVYGQALDATNNGIKNASEESILNVLRYKSAEYTGVLPFIVGAILAGITDEKMLETMKQYGLCFGWAFQIQDDALGLFGDEDEIGKSVVSDLREGKNTLFMLHLSQHGTPEQLAFQKEVLGNPNVTKEDLYKMREILKEVGSYQYVIDLGWSYVEKGKKLIPLISSDKKYQDIMESLLVYMMERAK